MIFNASGDDLFVYLKFLKQKPDGSWEKPSLKEGKSIKLGIEESIQILAVFEKEAFEFSTFHSFKETKTPISFKWDTEEALGFWINAGERNKFLSAVQVEMFRLLLKHVIKEQVAYGTVPKAKEAYTGG